MMGRTRKPVKYVVVDAFTDCEFKGNPATVCLLEEEREDEWLQSVAAEFNFSETCYLKSIPVLDSPHPRFHLRWFAPTNEVEICGHATLAAAHFCFTSGLVKANTIEFSTLSGLLTAQKVSEMNGSVSYESENSEKNQVSLIELNFPAAATSDCSIEETALLSKVFIHETVIDMKKTDINYLFVVLPSSKAVIDACLDFEEIKKCPGNGLIISAAAPFGSGFDIVSRFFAPKVDVNEDPVCGSAHCALAVYWSKKLGKTDLVAYAASRRGGILKLHWDEQNNRVKIQGHAVTIMEGSIVV